MDEIEKVLRNERTWVVANTDVLAGLRALPDGCVNVCVTSPPYWQLRDYGYEGQLGLEPTPEEFIANQVAVFAEVRRVLREDGCGFVNIGDSYSGSGRNGYEGDKSGLQGSTAGQDQSRIAKKKSRRRDDAECAVGGRQVIGKPLDLMGIPWQLALALRGDGWYLREDIIWAKKCLSGGTWLYARTAKGDAPAMVKDLARLSPETVKLWDGTKWVQVLGWSKTPSEDRRDLLEITLRSGERIGCTADHRWPTERGVLFARDLLLGDVIETCKLPDPEPAPTLCIPEGELGWLCGFYLAEGCRTSKGVSFSVHSDEREAAERITALARLFGGTASFSKRRGNSSAIVVYSKPLASLIAEFITGANCYNKRLGRKAWMRGEVFLRGMLDGYLEGDGHWDTAGGRWRIGFCNNDGLAIDIRCLCARLGEICVLKRAKHSCAGKLFSGWRGSIRKESNHHNAKPLGQIVSIGKSRAREFWDISVDQEPNLFALASGVLSHNSPMPESINGWRWEKCKIKTKAGESPARNGKPQLRRIDENPDLPTVASAFPANAEWSDCPGCAKCAPNDGYVLRRGSWRHTRSHEYIFTLTKSSDYFCDAQAVAEAAAQPGRVRADRVAGNGHNSTKHSDGSIFTGTKTRNPRSVRHLATEPSKEKHFASFPTELVRPLLLVATSEKGHCSKCGLPVVRIIRKDRIATRPALNNKVWRSQECDQLQQRSATAPNLDPERHIQVTETIGWKAACNCGATTQPGLVLDPYAGTGTTLVVARRLGLRAIGFDGSAEYVAIARKRITADLPLLNGLTPRPAENSRERGTISTGIAKAAHGAITPGSGALSLSDWTR